ncbi:hypothetical protein SDC9_132642 [bioreactor metagenome]|uniref:Uncharacterized protein n=1 Tax=bioreactor metagenome TaxID=1076179 RepID=A0A645D8I1_9ZZZZ
MALQLRAHQVIRGAGAHRQVEGAHQPLRLQVVGQQRGLPHRDAQAFDSRLPGQHRCAEAHALGAGNVFVIAAQARPRGPVVLAVVRDKQTGAQQRARIGWIGRVLLEKIRAAHRLDDVLEQKVCVLPLPRPIAHLDRQIDGVAVEVHGLYRVGDDHRNVLVARMKIRQARDQPLGGKGGVGLDAQRVVRPAAHDAGRGLGDGFEGRGDLLAVVHARLRQADAVALAAEQLYAQIGLQHVELLADRRLADVQLLRRLGQILGAHDGVKHLQWIERRQLFRHGVIVGAPTRGPRLWRG